MNHLITYSSKINAVNGSLDIKTIAPELYEQSCKNNNNYEYIPDDRPIKFYLDVDIKPNDDDEYDESYDMLDMCPIIEERIIALLKGGFGECYDESEIAIGTSHSNKYIPWKHDKHTWKISHRIVINNIIMTKKMPKIVR
jgi:hypothetical protein